MCLYLSRLYCHWLEPVVTIVGCSACFGNTECLKWLMKWRYLHNLVPMVLYTRIVNNASAGGVQNALYVVVVVILMAFLANLYPLRELLYGYPILLYGVMLSIACACLLKWEETGVPGGNPRKHGENMQTPHRKARAGPETNPGPSCCEATALTTAPPCRPKCIIKSSFLWYTVGSIMRTRLQSVCSLTVATITSCRLSLPLGLTLYSTIVLYYTTALIFIHEDF